MKCNCNKGRKLAKLWNVVLMGKNIRQKIEDIPDTCTLLYAQPVQALETQFLHHVCEGKNR